MNKKSIDNDRVAYHDLIVRRRVEIRINVVRARIDPIRALANVHRIRAGKHQESNVENQNLNFEKGIDAPFLDFKTRPFQTIGKDKLYILTNANK